MDDLISRQAAIDAIFSEPLYESGMKIRDADSVVPAIYEKIKSLPSAQPEPSGEYARGYNDAKREIALSGEYERAYQRGKEDAQQWIP